MCLTVCACVCVCMCVFVVFVCEREGEKILMPASTPISRAFILFLGKHSSSSSVEEMAVAPTPTLQLLIRSLQGEGASVPILPSTC